MPRYKLNAKAAADFERLYEWGIHTFGLSAARDYAFGMLERFDQIADNPLLWREVDEIKEGYRRSVYRAHGIYYRMAGDGVEIMRVLKHEDAQTALESEPQ